MILLKVVGAPVGIDVVRSHLRDRMRQDLGLGGLQRGPRHQL